jgi:hypothetical protein
MTTRPEPTDKLDTTPDVAAAVTVDVVGVVNGPEDDAFSSNAAQWRTAENDVRLQL